MKGESHDKTDWLCRERRRGDPSQEDGQAEEKGNYRSEHCRRPGCSILLGMLCTVGKRQYSDMEVGENMFDKSYDLKVEGFKKIKRKELEFTDIIKKEKAPKSTPHRHFYNITILEVKQ